VASYFIKLHPFVYSRRGLSLAANISPVELINSLERLRGLSLICIDILSEFGMVRNPNGNLRDEYLNEYFTKSTEILKWSSPSAFAWYQKLNRLAAIIYSISSFCRANS